MTVRLDQMMAEISPERRAKINNRAAEIVPESRTIAQLRKGLGVTQKTVAGKMKITQASLSEIETRGDAKISTLKRLVEAMGAKLRVYAEMPEGTQVPLAIAPAKSAAVRSPRVARSGRAAAKPKTVRPAKQAR